MANGKSTPKECKAVGEWMAEDAIRHGDGIEDSTRVALLGQLRAELLGIAHMDVLQRPGEAPADQLMRQGAERAIRLLNQLFGDNN